MIFGILPLLVLIGLVAGVVALVRRAQRSRGAGHAAPQHPPGELRRGAELALLAVVSVIAVIGASGLLTRLLDALAGVPLDEAVGATARSLAFVFVAGPLTALGWWWRWRHTTEAERPSPVWALFLTTLSTLSLVVWSVAGFRALGRGIEGRFDRGATAMAVVWLAAWGAHRWVERRSNLRPTRFREATPSVGSAVGLVEMVVGGVVVLQTLVGRALESGADVLVAGGSEWWRSLVGWLAFTAGAAGLWLLHWAHDGARRSTTVPAQALVAVTGVVAGAVLTLLGVGMGLFDLLRWLADTGVDLPLAEPSLGTAAGLAAVGALSWTYHARIATPHATVVRRSTGLALSGIGLATAATGLGIIVNAAIGALGSTLAGSGMRELLAGGLSTLAVGAPLWVASWRPGVHIVDPEQRHWAGRQVYLVLVFGASALTALVTTLVIGYQLFERLLQEAPDRDLVEQVRVALGLLTATVVVAAYHFPVWRRDRTIRERREHLAEPATSAGAPATGAGVIVLVAGARGAELEAELEQRLGAKVVRWQRADAGDGTDEPDAERVLAAIAAADVHAPRVLVVTGPHDHVEVVPLER